MLLVALWEQGLLAPDDIDRCLRAAEGEALPPAPPLFPAAWAAGARRRRAFPELDATLGREEQAALRRQLRALQLGVVSGVPSLKRNCRKFGGHPRPKGTKRKKPAAGAADGGASGSASAAATADGGASDAEEEGEGEEEEEEADGGAGGSGDDEPASEGEGGGDDDGGST